MQEMREPVPEWLKPNWAWGHLSRLGYDEEQGKHDDSVKRARHVYYDIRPRIKFLGLGADSVFEPEKKPTLLLMTFVRGGGSQSMDPIEILNSKLKQFFGYLIPHKFLEHKVCLMGNP